MEHCCTRWRMEWPSKKGIKMVVEATLNIPSSALCMIQGCTDPCEQGEGNLIESERVQLENSLQCFYSNLTRGASWGNPWSPPSRNVPRTLGCHTWRGGRIPSDRAMTMLGRSQHHRQDSAVKRSRTKPQQAEPSRNTNLWDPTFPTLQGWQHQHSQVV